MLKVIKRNGNLVDYDVTKIANAIKKAFQACDMELSDEEYNNIADSVPIWNKISVEEIQDEVEEILMDEGYTEVAKEYILYRDHQATQREQRTKGIFKGIINTENNDVTRENANMNSDSPAGMMMKFASETTKPFVDNNLLSPAVKEAVENNYMHIHDKDYYPTRSLTCLQHPLDRILTNGFKAGHGESRGAKRIETASILAAISMETIQNEMHK